jgi:hypothetical protein
MARFGCDDWADPVDPEVVEQRAIALERLRTDAGRRGDEVGNAQIRQVAARLGGERTAKKRSAQLMRTPTPMASSQRTKALGAKRLQEIVDANVAAAISLARKRQHSVRPDINAAGDPTGEVHPEKRVRRIRDRIEQAANEPFTTWNEPVVLAPEGNDPRLVVVTGQARNPVGMQTGTENEPVELIIVPAGIHTDMRARDAHRRHLRAQHDTTARRPHVLGETRRDSAVVRDGRRRRVQAGDTCGVRLERAQLGPVDPAQTRNSVGAGAALQLPQTIKLPFVDRDDQLPALLEREISLSAIGAQKFEPASTELGLERPGRVVDAGVNDAAVVTSLMQGDVALLLEHGDLRVGAQLCHAAGYGETDDPGANHTEAQRRQLSPRNELRSSWSRPS